MNTPMTPRSASRTRTFTWSKSVLNLAECKSLTGLECLQRLLQEGTPPPICELMDFYPVKFEYGLAVFQGVPAEFHYNPLGTVHGGFAATLLDSALGCSVQTTLKAGFAFTTIELHVNYVRSMSAQTGLVTCEGRTISVGSRVATAEAKLTGPDGKLYAHGTTTCLIIPLSE